jgi:hypothetical protein
MSKESSPVVKGANEALAVGRSVDRLRSSSDSLDSVVLTDTTGTVGIIFIEQKEGIVVLMCAICLPPLLCASASAHVYIFCGF